MSWSVYVTGTPDAVCRELDKTLESYSAGQSRDEFAAAVPHLKGLVSQNFVDLEKAPCYCGQPMVKLDASGSGSSTGGTMVQQTCQCKIEVISPNCK